jgi:hypothetical protein
VGKFFNSLTFDVFPALADLTIGLSVSSFSVSVCVALCLR